MALTYREKKKKMKIFQNNSPKNDLREISSIINDYLRSILASNEIIISIRRWTTKRLTLLWRYPSDIHVSGIAQFRSSFVYNYKKSYLYQLFLRI